MVTSASSQIVPPANVNPVPLEPTMTGPIDKHNLVETVNQGTPLARKEAPADSSVDLVRSLEKNCTLYH